jgi:hypothetical protein
LLLHLEIGFLGGGHNRCVHSTRFGTCHPRPSLLGSV